MEKKADREQPSGLPNFSDFPETQTDPVSLFLDFILEYTDADNNPIYLNKTREIARDGEPERYHSLYVDFMHVMDFDSGLAIHIHENPKEYCKKASQALVNQLHDLNDKFKLDNDNCFIRFFNL